MPKGKARPNLVPETFWKDLIEYVRAGNDCRLIMIGDSAQLPPVGMDASPALAKEYMDGFGGVCYSSLTEVVRQQKKNQVSCLTPRNYVS